LRGVRLGGHERLCARGVFEVASVGLCDGIEIRGSRALADFVETNFAQCVDADHHAFAVWIGGRDFHAYGARFSRIRIAATDAIVGATA